VEKDRYGRWVGEIWLNVGGEPPEIFLQMFSLIQLPKKLKGRFLWNECPLANKFSLIQLPKKLKGLPSRRLAMSGLYTPESEGVKFCHYNLTIFI
jgi:hypothetical protein